MAKYIELPVLRQEVTVPRYARAERVEELPRPPRYGACLADPYRDLVRQGRPRARRTPHHAAWSPGS